MLFINHLWPDEWWEWNIEEMTASNYFGGWCEVDENALGGVEYFRCNNWHELYLAKHFCPLEVGVRESEVWISPEGKFYKGDAHTVQAKYICDIIYGKDLDFDCAEDYLEERGWCRATANLMWEVRLDSWKEKRITQKQVDALWDWCEYHNKTFPIEVGVI